MTEAKGYRRTLEASQYWLEQTHKAEAVVIDLNEDDRHKQKTCTPSLALLLARELMLII